MRYTPKQYATALFESLSAEPAREHTLLKRFAELVVKNNDRALTPHIIRRFKRLLRERAGVHEALVTTAKKAPTHLIAEIKRRIGGDVHATERVDPSVLGGVRIVIDDEEIIDGTFKKRINDIFQRKQ